jgi:hypothetical protein
MERDVQREVISGQSKLQTAWLQRQRNIARSSIELLAFNKDGLEFWIDHTDTVFTYENYNAKLWGDWKQFYQLLGFTLERHKLSPTARLLDRVNLECPKSRR